MNHILKRLRFYLHWPGLVLYFSTRHRARVAIVDDSGRILLVRGQWKRWYDDDGWGLPGGGMQAGELPAAALVRELSEELGMSVTESSLEQLVQERITDHGISYQAHLFKLVVSPDTAFTIEPGELTDAEWCDIHALHDRLLKADVRRVVALL